LTRAEIVRRRALVDRARALIPELPTAALYRITALLERALASPEIDPDTYDELERALRANRTRSKRRDL
jgi:hypothetical protein